MDFVLEHFYNNNDKPCKSSKISRMMPKTSEIFDCFRIFIIFIFLLFSVLHLFSFFVFVFFIFSFGNVPFKKMTIFLSKLDFWASADKGGQERPI